ncbi:hypothetical protein SHKM778_32120 [Streptomyces sp. KM77-8]|uniref:Uncharacterized protein n=1 Tax=Streptomyces haneummycinicus TaxID=3074435 RepID=A0AAT9HHD7_9ACTN
MVGNDQEEKVLRHAVSNLLDQELGAGALTNWRRAILAALRLCVGLGAEYKMNPTAKLPAVAAGAPPLAPPMARSEGLEVGGGEIHWNFVRNRSFVPHGAAY